MILTTMSTVYSTSVPTLYPTLSPTNIPTTITTITPTFDPTSVPISIPTNNAKTNAATNYDVLTCGSHITGEYNLISVHLQIKMPYDGDMLFNFRESDFEILFIEAYDSNWYPLASVESDILIVPNLSHDEEYSITFYADDGVSGIFDLRVACIPNGPSLSPTNEPTSEPTTEPTFTVTSTIPTEESSGKTATPFPFDPGELTCGSHIRTPGAYNGSPLTVEVRMPYDGDMTVNLGASDFEIAEISAFDSDGNALTDSEGSIATMTIYNLTRGRDYTFIIEGVGYVYTGMFDIYIECSFDEPTTSPTIEPSYEPTMEPTINLSNYPTTSPTLEPTINPTMKPSPNPTIEPTINPSNYPTLEPTVQSTASSTKDPTTFSPTEHSHAVEVDGCCAGDTERSNARCINMETEDSCTRRSSCHWIETSDVMDCMWMGSGCCAGNSLKAVEWCDYRFSHAECNRRSSCHWMASEDHMHCEWSEEDEPMASGCCFAAHLESLTFSIDLCREYWNENECLISYDANGDQNCRWEPTDDNVDCTKFMRTELIEVQPHEEEEELFGATSIAITMPMEGELSLFSVSLLLVAILAVFRAYSSWKVKRYDGYEKLEERQLSVYATNVIATNYQSMA